MKIRLLSYLFLLCGGASANMMVYPMSMKISGDEKSAETLKVISQSEQTQYIRVTIKQVINPATVKEHEVDVQNWQGNGLVVSPAKFALPAGTTKIVRAISLSMPTSEQVYRVYFEPVAAPEDAGVNAKNNIKKTQANINFSVVWGVLVRQLPVEKTLQLSYSPSASEIKNNGNIRISLEKYSFCEVQKNERQCQWKDINKNLYPNESMKIDAAKKTLPMRIKYRNENDQTVEMKLIN